MNKSDIQTRDHIELIINSFYEHLIHDDRMSFFFKELVESGSLKKHLNRIIDFWEDILLDTQYYSSNVMKKHLNVHQQIPFKKEHFQLWLNFLHTTIDELHQGPVSEMMKTRANSIAMVMQLKMNLYES